MTTSESGGGSQPIAKGDPLTFGPKKRPRSRLLIPAVLLIAGFLIGVSVMTLSLVVVVTPKVHVLGIFNARTGPTCDGWPQLSFDGYFNCAVTFNCNSEFGNFYIDNATVPAATNVHVTPTLPLAVNCGSPQVVRVTGQLGYSGIVEVYFG